MSDIQGLTFKLISSCGSNIIQPRSSTIKNQSFKPIAIKSIFDQISHNTVYGLTYILRGSHLQFWTSQNGIIIAL